jgi:PTH2 family peptidyl-tRNA hydrolase
MNVKQVIVMRTKFPHPTKNGEFIKPRRGKMIAPACHASLKIFFDRMEKVYWGERGSPNADNEYDWVSELTPEMESWKNGHFTKICVYVNSEEELLEAVRLSEQAGLPTALIKDSGLTEFDGVPTNTCCAIGPAMSSKIDVITGEMPLY